MAAIRSLAALAALSLVQNVHAWYPQLPPCVDPFRPFVYAGCFQDKGTPEALIVRADLDTQDMTIEKCQAFCKGNGFRYAGLEYYGECFCGQSVNQPQVDDSLCTYPCTGNSSQICGGSDLISVYTDTTFQAIDDTLDYESLGCYSDDGEARAIFFRQEQLDYETMTVEKCLTACHNQGYPFAGVEWYGECYCANVLGNFTEKVDEGECNTPCKGNNNQTCGGPARINVYVSKELASLEPCGYQPPVSTTTPPTTTTTAPTSTSTLCVSTVTLPSKCEYGCGKWCASELPDWDDDSGCKNGVSNCKLQVSACFKKAGFPGAMECFEFSKWCNDIDSWRGSNCKHGKCKKSDCFKSKPPKNHKPPTTTTTHVPCKPTTTTSSRPTSTKCAIPTVTNICKQPSSYQHGYGPGKPVGGVELPVVTCNDLKDQFSQAPFKLYTESDSRKCGAFPRNKLPEACAAACKAQYEECIDVYAEGCKQKKRRGETYFDIAAADAEEKSKRWFNWKDSYTTAVNKCKAQYYDCKSENKYANAGSKCFSWGHGW